MNIELKGVSKVFQTKRKAIHALQDITLQIAEGELVSLLGPSGCGKSTIIRMLVDIIKPTAGEICLGGKKILAGQRIDAEVVQNMGFIFQLPNLYPWLTVRENIILPLKVFRKTSRENLAYADHLMNVMGLREYGDLYPVEISGGMMQRVGVVRAMVHQPKILLMDEPFGALDETTREILNMELLEIWQRTRMTIIFITHNVEEAVLISSRVYVMGTNPGSIIDEVTIPLPRPRSLGMIEYDEFISICDRLVQKIGHLDLDKIK